MRGIFDLKFFEFHTAQKYSSSLQGLLRYGAHDKS